jgi:putative endonuclease
MERGSYVYILTNKNNTMLFVGVTSHLRSRIYEHKSKLYPQSFTAKYNLDKLAYFESFSHIAEAIAPEKQLKAGSRKKKEALINQLNPNWH